MGKPKIGILDPKFRWTSSAKTDIRQTFEKERQRLQEEQGKKNEEEATKVVKLKWSE